MSLGALDPLHVYVKRDELIEEIAGSRERRHPRVCPIKF